MDSSPSRAFAPLIFILPRSISDRLAADAKTAYPRECCGFLLGQNRDGKLRVDGVMPVENMAPGRARYEMSPEAVLFAERSAGRRGASILGAYHSHPDGEARPSETDRREAITNLPYVIMSIESSGLCRTSAWMLEQSGRFRMVRIEGLEE